jgi:hypothetical protein
MIEGMYICVLKTTNAFWDSRYIHIHIYIYIYTYIHIYTNTYIYIRIYIYIHIHMYRSIAIHTTCYEHVTKVFGLKATNAFWNPRYYNPSTKTITKQILYINQEQLIEEIRSLTW